MASKSTGSNVQTVTSCSALSASIVQAAMLWPPPGGRTDGCSRRTRRRTLTGTRRAASGRQRRIDQVRVVPGRVVAVPEEGAHESRHADDEDAALLRAARRLVHDPPVRHGG